MKVMRRSNGARLEWGTRLARRRENVRLARAAQHAHEIEQEVIVGQFLIFGFGGAPRLINFIPCGRSMRACDALTGVDVPVPPGLPWRVARLEKGTLNAGPQA